MSAQPWPASVYGQLVALGVAPDPVLKPLRQERADILVEVHCVSAVYPKEEATSGVPEAEVQRG